MTAALTLDAATAQIGRQRVIEGVSLTVAPGELVGVIGPNGAGKTSLIRAALGLLRVAGTANILDVQAISPSFTNLIVGLLLLAAVLLDRLRGGDAYE